MGEIGPYMFADLIPGLWQSISALRRCIFELIVTVHAFVRQTKSILRGKKNVPSSALTIEFGIGVLVSRTRCRTRWRDHLCPVSCYCFALL